MAKWPSIKATLDGFSHLYFFPLPTRYTCSETHSDLSRYYMDRNESQFIVTNDSQIIFKSVYIFFNRWLEHYLSYWIYSELTITVRYCCPLLSFITLAVTFKKFERYCSLRNMALSKMQFYYGMWGCIFKMYFFFANGMVELNFNRLLFLLENSKWENKYRLQILISKKWVIRSQFWLIWIIQIRQFVNLTEWWNQSL